ncbi:MAG: hypothetical protein IKK93_05620 [Campylobacter sp.]|nr:hypothetical protein [Campylobacter sp.]
MINVGIIGCGVIGGIMKKWLENHNPECKILVLDPPKGMNDDLSIADIIFISIHIPTEENRTQDLSLLKNILKACPNVPIFIRTTLLPGTCDKLSEEFGRKIYFMPEFLTERTAYEDFCIQSMIYTGCENLMKRIFIGKHYITMSNLEAEIAKYAHNVFGAIKVTYFNGIYELAKQHNCDFENIRKGALLSGYINEPHTMVPGPDGKTGYGGKCFPKDVLAFSDFCQTTKIGKLLDDIENINKEYRDS